MPESRDTVLHINLSNNAGLFFMCLNMKRRQSQSKSAREKERDNERQTSKLNEKEYLVDNVCNSMLLS